MLMLWTPFIFPQKTLIISGQISARLSASVSTSRGRLCLLRPILVLVSKIKTVYHKSGYWSCLLRPKVFSLGLDLSLPFRSAYTPFYHKASLPVPVTAIIPILSSSYCYHCRLKLQFSSSYCHNSNLKFQFSSTYPLNFSLKEPLLHFLFTYCLPKCQKAHAWLVGRLVGQLVGLLVVLQNIEVW